MNDEFITIKPVRSRKRKIDPTIELRRGRGVDTNVFMRLQTAVEAASRDGLENVLSAIHAKAVELAPIRKDGKMGKHGLINGTPPQLWAPGLLKNSIGYYIKGDDHISGLNSHGGEYRVSEDMNKYPRNGMKFGARKSAGTIQGFVGTFVSHMDYVNWSDTYTYRDSEKVTFDDGDDPIEVNTEYDRKIPKTSSMFSYGVWIEFNHRPFLRPAIYMVIDSGMYRNILAEVMKRDIRDLMAGAIPLDGHYMYAGSGRYDPTRKF